MNIARFSVENPVTVGLIMWVIILLGGVSWSGMVREFFPNSSAEAINVTIPYPGAAPDEVEELVTRRVEAALQDVEEVEEVRSRVLEGVSITTLKLDEGASLDKRLNDVRSRVDLVKPDLPQGTLDPEITEQRPLIPVISVLVYGDVREEKLRDAAKKLRDELRGLPDLSRVTLAGVRERELLIEVDPQALEEHGLTFGEVGRAVASANLDLAGGQLKGAQGNVRVRTMGEADDPARLTELPVRAGAGGDTVRLGSLGAVRMGFEDRVESGLHDGVPAILLSVLKTPEQDAIEISQRVKAFVAERTSRLAGSVKLKVVNDFARFIEQRLDLMLRNAKSGSILVLVTLAIFLNLRVAFWVGMGIPTAFLGSFVVMHWWGATINLMSLFAMIIVLGMLVDDAIVIGENVFTKLQAGVPPLRAAVEGTTEVGIPVVASVATTCVAFIPLAYIEGSVGAFLGVLPVVVIAALSVSLLEAFLILPAHLAHMKRGGPFDRIALLKRLSDRLAAFRERVFEDLVPRGVQAVTAFAVRWRYPGMALSIAMLLGSIGLVIGDVVPFVLLQETDAETLSCDLEMAAGTPEARTSEVLRHLEALVGAYAETEFVFGVVGTSFNDRGRVTPADPATVGQLTIQLHPADKREAQGLKSSKMILAELRRQTKDLPGVQRLIFSARDGGPMGADLEARVQAQDDAALAGAVAYVRDVLGTYTGVGEIRDDMGRGKLEVRFRLLESARALGLTTGALAQELRSAVFGFEAQELQLGEDQVKVRALLPEAARRGLADLGRLRIATPQGHRVPLEEVAELSVERGYATVTRVGSRRAVTVQADVDEDRANTSQVTADLEARLADVGLRFPGAVVIFEGRQKETLDSLGSLAIGFPLALFGVYAIIAMLFRSYLQPFMVMSLIPFGLCGAVIGHFVMGYPLTILSLIGLVAVSGIVVNDSIVLVDYVNHARWDGTPLVQAVVQGAGRRVRAILLTSITTIAGLAPLMAERSFQAQFLIPMAVSICFGLGFTTVLVLVIVPMLYVILEDLKASVTWLFTGEWSWGVASGRPGEALEREAAGTAGTGISHIM